MATVLVVDDEPIVREVVVRYLEREGYATLEAGDGDGARKLLDVELTRRSCTHTSTPSRVIRTSHSTASAPMSAACL